MLFLSLRDVTSKTGSCWWIQSALPCGHVLNPEETVSPMSEIVLDFFKIQMNISSTNKTSWWKQAICIYCIPYIDVIWSTLWIDMNNQIHPRSWLIPPWGIWSHMFTSPTTRWCRWDLAELDLWCLSCRWLYPGSWHHTAGTAGAPHGAGWEIPEDLLGTWEQVSTPPRVCWRKTPVCFCFFKGMEVQRNPLPGWMEGTHCLGHCNFLTLCLVKRLGQERNVMLYDM